MDWTNVLNSVCTAASTIIGLIVLLNKKFDKIDGRLNEIQKDIRQLDNRVLHIEGYLIGRNQKNGTEKN